MAALEETPEGLAAAAHTREQLKTKKRQLEAAAKAAGAPPPKRLAPPPSTCTHEVSVPDGYQPGEQEQQLDPATYGELESAREGVASHRIEGITGTRARPSALRRHLGRRGAQGCRQPNRSLPLCHRHVLCCTCRDDGEPSVARGAGQAVPI